MNFKYIEELVTECKNGDMLSKEKLAEEFRPLIFNISKRTFIDRYEIYDVQNECYQTLFKCVSLYNLEKHRFVAYATNAIKNNMNDLIKRIKTRSSTEGNDALSLHEDVEKDLPSQDISLEDLFCDQCDYDDLRLAIYNLSEDEKELIDFIFYKNNTVQNYAYFKNMCYSTANLKKKVTLKKIFDYINIHFNEIEYTQRIQG
jgi:RNA polymerase sigma factor (sigma-70 family)